VMEWAGRGLERSERDRTTTGCLRVSLSDFFTEFLALQYRRCRAKRGAVLQRDGDGRFQPAKSGHVSRPAGSMRLPALRQGLE